MEKSGGAQRKVESHGEVQRQEVAWRDVGTQSRQSHIHVW